MRPMNDAALGVPFVHTIKLHRIASLQGRDSQRDIDIVSDKQRLPGCEREYEPLVAGPFCIVRKDSGNNALSRHLDAVPSIPNSAGERFVDGCRRAGGL